MSYWLLLTAQHITDTYKDFVRESRYEIAPGSKIKKGDRVYLWWVVDGFMFGWGSVSETPRISETSDSQGRKLKRLVVPVTREVGFEPPLTRQQIETDNKLVGLIPHSLDDLYAIELDTIQANHLNDIMRTLGLEAPKGSATIRWSVERSWITIDKEFYRRRPWAVAISIGVTTALSVLGLFLTGFLGLIVGIILGVTATLFLPPPVLKYIEKTHLQA